MNEQPQASASSGRRRRALRWLVPLGAAGIIALLASGVLSATATPSLAPQTAAQLIASISTSSVDGFSGTVVEKASLGLPELPNVGGSGATTGITGLLTGSHTSRIWYGGPSKQRVALLDSFGEQDVFRNARELWTWHSDQKTYTHTVLPADAGAGAGKGMHEPPGTPTISPDDAALRALALIEPSTTVTTDHSSVVAGRAAYTLVLTPKDPATRVGSIRISVDGKTKLPLGVQIYARNADHAALDVSFTRIDFSVPGDEYFTFTPPSGATSAPDSFGGQGAFSLGTGKSSHPDVTTVGRGWTTVVKINGVPSVLGGAPGPSGKGANDEETLSGVLGALPPVTGSWGSGRLFQSALISALFTNDGRILIGAVDPAVLYAAAGTR